jgi:hypothetical protein
VSCQVFLVISSYICFSMLCTCPSNADILLLLSYTLSSKYESYRDNLPGLKHYLPIIGHCTTSVLRSRSAGRVGWLI